MADKVTIEKVEAIVKRLASAHWKERDTIKAELLAVASSDADRSGVESFLRELKRGLELELRWEIDEVLEDLAPEPEPEAEEEEEQEEDDPNRPLRMSDLQIVYDDPRGTRMMRTKDGVRWFLSEMDPYTQQPRTVELAPAQVEQLKQQLSGSPYWVLGTGEG